MEIGEFGVTHVWLRVMRRNLSWHCSTVFPLTTYETAFGPPRRVARYLAQSQT